MQVDDEVIKRLKHIRAGLTAWMDHPDRDHVRKEQKHIIKGTEEQIYWHWGRLVTLKDIIDLIENGIPTRAEDEPLVP